MSGRAWVFGDDIDTDVLAPGPYLKAPIAELAAHCLDAVDPDFARRVAPGDVVIAGANFGMGSSREQAAQALKELGVVAVIARSFAGIFYRNAFNLGLMALVSTDIGDIAPGARVAVDAEAGVLRDLTTDTAHACEPVPAHLMALVRDGGLVPHLERRLATARQESIAARQENIE